MPLHTHAYVCLLSRHTHRTRVVNSEVRRTGRTLFVLDKAKNVRGHRVAQNTRRKNKKEKQTEKSREKNQHLRKRARAANLRNYNKNIFISGHNTGRKNQL